MTVARDTVWTEKKNAVVCVMTQQRRQKNIAEAMIMMTMNINEYQLQININLTYSGIFNIILRGWMERSLNERESIDLKIYREKHYSLM